jgi:hypothetical protein
MKALVYGLLIFFSVSAIAQKSPVKFGEIPLEDLKMTIYDKDSSAAAVILVDYGEAYININPNNVALNFEKHTRIKILNKNGLKWADVMIPLYHSGSAEEKVSGLKASVYNLENGKIVESKMNKESVFKEKINRYFNAHKFTLPNVKEGSVIEYSYKIVSEFFTNFPNWQFQHTIPTRHSEYWALIPDFFVYEKYMQGYITANHYEVVPKNTSDYRSNGHHWIVKDVPAFKEEPFITSENDYISKVNFALSYIQFPSQPTREIMGTWEKLNSSLLESESFGKVINGSNYLKKQVEEITNGINDPIQKMTAIHNFVKSNIEWDGYNDHLAFSPKKILEEKKGSSGDINLLLASMLEKAGFEVQPVLLSTRDHGFVRRQYPMERQFNYVVCLVKLQDGKSVWLDATDKYLPINVLPSKCLNGQGLVISAKNYGWIDIQSKAKAKTVVNADLSLDPSGELKGKLNLLHDGYDAQKMRSEYVKKGKDGYVKEVFGSKPWQIANSDFQNVTELTQTPKQIHELTITDHASVAGDMIYINPYITSQIESNPFKLDNRVYPVDYGSMIENVYMCKLTIPDGYVIDEMPKSKVLMLPENAAKFMYNVGQNGNTINITSQFLINKNIFVQTEYPDLKEFYNQVVAKQTEQIVLKKK